MGNANKDDVDNFDREAMLLLLRLHVAFERDDQRASVVATIITEVVIVTNPNLGVHVSVVRVFLGYFLHKYSLFSGQKVLDQ